MTNKEAIEWIKYHIGISNYDETDDLLKAFETAIKALEQEPCDDCVSRQAVKSTMVRWKFNSMNAYLEADYEIDKLPSVTPQQETVTEFADRCRECGSILGKRINQKTGHWVKITPYPLQMHDYKCSECCHETDDNTENYCSECGARMMEKAIKLLKYNPEDKE